MIEAAVRLAKAAKANDWHGSFKCDVNEAEELYADLSVTRNDEIVDVQYINNAMTFGEYSILDKYFRLHGPGDAMRKLTGWPDVLKLLDWFPRPNHPYLVHTYRKLPFELADVDEVIMQKLFGQKISWYNRTTDKLASDVVLTPRKSNSQQYRIAPVGHRKMFHFVSQGAGFRSVMLDSIVKVG